MASVFNQYDWYWSVQDTNPSTQVYSSRVGGFIAIGDATYVAWLSADGGNVPTIIDTYASMCKVINQFAVVNYVARTQSFVVTGNVTLTNPPPNFIDFTNNTGFSYKFILPPANTPNSIPVGVPITFRNLSVGGGSFACSICLNDGTTILTNVFVGNTVTIMLKQNSSANGIWDQRIVGDAVKASDNTFTANNIFNGGRVIIGASTTGDSFPLSLHSISGTFDFGVSHWSGDAQAATIFIRKSRGTTPSVHGGVQNNDFLGGISFDASDGGGFKAGAQILATAKANAVSGQYTAAALAFYTSVGGAAGAFPLMRMSIGPDGTVSYLDAAGTTYASIAPGGTTGMLREKLTANRTYYVATTGLDTNTGLAVGTPFLTIQKAIDVAAGLDSGIFSVTINVANGTYTGNMVLKTMVGGGAIFITGNTASPTSCIISVTSGFPVQMQGVRTNYTLSGFHLKAVSAGYCCVLASQLSVLTLSAIRFEGETHIKATYSAQVVHSVSANSSVAGNFNIHIYADTQGTVSEAGFAGANSFTIVGTPVILQGWVFALQGAFVITNGNTYAGGTCTGPRYYVASMSYCYTGTSGSATYLPGSTAGSTASNGLYD